MVALELRRSDIGFGRVVIDDVGVTRHYALRSTSIAWDEIRDYRLTIEIRGTRFEVAHQGRGFDPGGFDAQGIGSVPNVKLIRRLGVVEAATLGQIEAAVKAWLGLP